MTRVAGRRWLLLAGILAALGGPAAAQQQDPAAPIRALNEGLLAVMRAGAATPFAERARMLTPAVQGAFDLPQILQASVGLRWANLPRSQQSNLLDLFSRFTVDNYVANFDRFAGERFVIAPEIRAVGADRVVQTRIEPASGESTRIDYQMRETPAGWRVVDVLLDGSISRVAVQRSDFRSLLDSDSAERLIGSLRNKIAGLESGQKP